MANRRITYLWKYNGKDVYLDGLNAESSLILAKKILASKNKNEYKTYYVANVVSKTDLKEWQVSDFYDFDGNSVVASKTCAFIHNDGTNNPYVRVTEGVIDDDEGTQISEFHFYNIEGTSYYPGEVIGQGVIYVAYAKSCTLSGKKYIPVGNWGTDWGSSPVEGWSWTGIYCGENDPGDNKNAYTWFCTAQFTGETCFTSFVFKRSYKDISEETLIGYVIDENGNYLPASPTGWTDTVTGDTNAPVWMSKRLFWTNSDLNTATTWSKPSLMSDSNTFNSEWSTAETLNHPEWITGDSGNFGNFDADEDKWRAAASVATNAEWSDNSNGAVWMATARWKNGAWENWGLSKIKGEQGEKGESSLRADFDNETISVACNEEYETIESVTYTANAIFNDGKTAKTISNINWTNKDVYEGKVSIVTSNTRVVITIYKNAQIDNNSRLEFIFADNDGQTAKTAINILMIKSNVIYSLLTEPKVVGKYEDRQYKTEKIICKVLKREAGQTTESPVTSGSYTIRYLYEGNETEATYPSTGVTPSAVSVNEWTWIKFNLYITGETEVLCDSETLYTITEASSTMIADIDNEMESIVVDKATVGDDYLVYEPRTLYTNVSLWSGTTSVTIDETIEIYEDTTYITSVTIGGAVRQLCDAITVSATREEGEEKVKLTFNAIEGKPFASKSYGIVLSPKNIPTRNFTLTFTIAAVKGGKDARIYTLVPSENEIINRSTLVKEPEILTYDITRKVGTTVSNIYPTAFTEEGITVVYNIDDTTDASTNDGKKWIEDVTYTGFTTANISKKIEMRIVTSGSTDFTPLDKETVYVVRDGVDGAGSYDLKLSSYSWSIPCDKYGNINPSAMSKVSCIAQLYYGYKEVYGEEEDLPTYSIVTSETTPSGITCETITVTDSSGNKYHRGNLKFDNNFQFGDDNGNVLGITIMATYGDDTEALHFYNTLTLSKAFPGNENTSYWLMMETRNVKINSAGTISHGAVGVTGLTQTGSDPVLIATSATINAYYKNGESIPGFTPKTGEPVSIPIEEEDFSNTGHSSIIVTMSVNSEQTDIEAINLTSDGVSPYRLDIDNENAGINCDSEGNILSGATRPTATATLYIGSNKASEYPDMGDVTYSCTTNISVTGLSLTETAGAATLVFNSGTSKTPFNFNGKDPLVIRVCGYVNGEPKGYATMNVCKNIAGADGNSITGVTEWYKITSAETPAPATGGTAAGWSTDIVNPTKENPYLWNYEEIHYSLKETTVTDPAIIAIYTEDGRSITAITNWYKLTTAETPTPATGGTAAGWVEKTPPKQSKEYPFLWNYEVIHYSYGDDTVTEPAIIGSIGINAVTYYLVLDNNKINIDCDDNITPASETIGVTAMTQEGENEPVPYNAGQIIYRYDDSSETVVKKSATTISISDCISHNSLIVRLKAQDKQRDLETIPITKDGKNATSPYRLDLSNQNAGINCDSDGNILSGAIRPSCIFTLFYGDTAMTEGVTYESAVTPTTVSGLSLDLEDREIVFNQGSSSNPFNFTGADVLKITLTAKVGGIAVGTAVMNVNKNFGGENAVTYWINTSSNAIRVDDFENASPTVINVDAYKQIGEQTPTSYGNGKITAYYINQDGTTAWTTSVTTNHLTINNIKTYKNCASLVVKLDDAENVQRDLETIPIVKDGASPYRLDLSNENASINCDSEGNILSGATRPTCVATLYYGSSTVSGVQYAITNKTLPTSGLSIVASSGTLNFSSNFNFTGGTSLEITVTATLAEAECGKKVMTVSKNLAGVDGSPAVSSWIELSTKEVKVDKDGTAWPETVTGTVYKQVGGETPAIGQGYRIKYGYNTTDPTSYVDATSKTVTVDTTKDYLCFKLYTGETYLGECETVPILVDGVDGQSAYRLDISNQNASINCDSDGNILAGAERPECTATLFLGEKKASECGVGTVRYGYSFNVSTVSGLTCDTTTGVMTFNNGTSSSPFNFTGTSMLKIKVIAYVDGKTAGTATMNVSKNIAGKDGTSGVSITGITEYYGKNNSTTVAPSTWSTAVTTPDKDNPYLWNKEVIHYSNGKSEPTTPCIIGKYSADGRGITGITEYYYTSTSNTTYPATGSTEWVKKAVTPTPEKPYLWNYELVNYTDGTTSATVPVIIGASGQNGASGQSAISFWLGFSAKEIVVSTAGTITPTSIVVTAMTQVGENTPVGSTGGSIKYRYIKGTTESGTTSVVGQSAVTINNISTYAPTYDTLEVSYWVGGIQRDIESIPILKEKKDGENGRSGAAVRGPIRWEVGKTQSARRWSNGVGPESDDELWIDIITHTNADKTSFTYYRCVTSYTETGADWTAKSSDNIVVKDHWASANTEFQFVAANLLLAQNAAIDFLTGNEIYLRDEAGNITAGAQGGNGISFWAGSSAATKGAFMVDYQGGLTATSATIKGRVSAETGNIGGISITNNGISASSANGSFSLSSDGILKAKNGNFSGAVSADSGNIGGISITNNGISASSANGSFSLSSDGTLNAKNGNFSGAVSADSGYFNGAISADSGNIGGISITSTGISASSSTGSFSLGSDGTLNAKNGYFEGTISAETGVFAGYARMKYVNISELQRNVVMTSSTIGTYELWQVNYIGKLSQAPTIANELDCFYNTSNSKYNIYKNSVWNEMTALSFRNYDYIGDARAYLIVFPVTTSGNITETLLLPEACEELNGFTYEIICTPYYDRLRTEEDKPVFTLRTVSGSPSVGIYAYGGVLPTCTKVSCCGGRISVTCLYTGRKTYLETPYKWIVTQCTGGIDCYVLDSTAATTAGTTAGTYVYNSSYSTVTGYSTESTYKCIDKIKTDSTLPETMEDDTLYVTRS